MDERFAAAWARLPNYLSQHAMLSAAALILGLLIAGPLAIAATRRPRLRWALLTVSNTVQTIPSLALLALFYPLLLGLAALTQSAFGFSFSAFGFLPAVLALTLYSMLPILRNTLAGLASVDPDIVEAARGVGMTDRQSLFRVELPLAAPIILAGVRTSAVWVIGTATLSTPIGQTSLGNYIFTGLQTENWVFVLFGCVAAAALALITDQLLGLIEAGLAKRDRPRTALGAAGLAIVAALAIAPAFVSAGAAYRIGGKTFTEQYILARLIADRINAEGESAQLRVGLGSAIALRALSENDIDVYVDYTGTIWANAMHRTDNPGRAEVAAQVSAWLKKTYGVTMLGELGFENTYALAMKRDKADALAISSIADLAPHAPDMKIGGDYEFFARPEWAALKSAYGLRFAAQKQFQSTFMYGAVANGDVDVISAFSSDGRIARYDLKVLSDPRHAIPPYDAIILIAPARANDQRLKDALTPLLHAISADDMRKANEIVDGPSRGATSEAARWLWDRIEAAQGAGAVP
jgi:osmoprotectant transport system permease protein